jgi:Na+/H+-dicarboxylate symporters
MGGGKSFFRKYLEFPVIYKIAIAFILGIIAAVVLQESISFVKPVGDIFMRLLKMLAMPIIFFTLVLGSSNLELKRFGKVGGEVIAFYFITSFIAATIGLVMALIIKPGVGLSLEGVTFTPITPPSLIDTVVSWIPTNPFAAMADPGLKQILPTIIFALMFGLALSHLKSSEKTHDRKIASTLVDVFDACSEIMFKIVRFVLEVAPYGVFALIAVNIGGQGLGIFTHYGRLIAADYIGMFLHILLVYGIILMIFKVNPAKFLWGAKDAMLTAYVTRSSAGTLPVTMRCADERLGISKQIYSFSLPLGATINMDGTGLHMIVVAVMAANLIGHQLTGAEMLILIVTVVMASVGTAALPSASLIMLVGVLSSVGLPLEIIGLVAGVDVVSDMMRTMTNVTGDLTCTTVMAKVNGLMDKTKGVWAKG